MVDVVMNHMGGLTDTLVQNFSPFNESSHYHDCYYNCCSKCGCCSTQVKDCKEVGRTENASETLQSVMQLLA